MNSEGYPVKLLTVAEVAAQLRCSEATIRRRMRRGEIAFIRMRGIYRIHPAEVELYVQLSWDFGEGIPDKLH